MSDSDHDKERDEKIRRQLKREADEILFADIRFDDRMKQAVLERAEAPVPERQSRFREKPFDGRPDEAVPGRALASSERQASSRAIPFDGRADEAVPERALPSAGHRRTARFGGRRTARWIGAAAAAAVAVGILFATGPSFFPPSPSPAASPQPSPVVAADGSGEAAGQSPAGGGQAPDNGEQTPNQVLLAPTGSDGGAETGPQPDNGVTTWQPQSIDEARTAFGDRLLAPGYIPEGFTIHELDASGKMAGTADSITFGYASDSRRFALIQRKQEQGDAPPEDGKTVDINGHAGYMRDSRTAEPAGDEDANTEIHWYADGVQYTVSGQLPEEEALKVARSLDEPQTPSDRGQAAK